MKINHLISRLPVLLAFGALVSFTSCDDDDPIPVDNTVTGKVVADPNFSTLELAVGRAGLATTLSGAGPFTVFAPDNAAFAAAGITETVLNSLTPAQVSAILLYHTIGAKILATDVPAGPNAKVVTAGGDSVFVTRNATGVFVNGIQVTQANIEASNGVVHKIGRVLNPPAGNIVATATAAGLDSLVKAVLRATNGPGGDPSLAGALSNSLLTVFAPTNQAFTNLLPVLGVNNINLIDAATLANVLKYHVVGSRAFSSDLANGSLAMLAAGNTTISLTSGATIRGNGNGANASNITATNIVCRNGVVHLIDRVLLP